MEEKMKKLSLFLGFLLFTTFISAIQMNVVGEVFSATW